MPRNSSGVYQLPAGNPVAPGTLIESKWANDTLTDLAQAMTGSLARDGSSTMAAPFLAMDGGVSAPGIAFGAESSTGLFRKTAKVLGVAVGGLEVASFTQAGLVFSGAMALADDEQIRWGDGSAFIKGNGTTDVLSFGTLGAEKARFMQDGTDPVLLIGTTVPTLALSANGRTLLDINATTTATINLAIAGVATAYLNTSATRTLVGSRTAIPLAFFTKQVEKARLTESDDAQLLVGSTSAFTGSTGRGLIGVNGSSEAILEMGNASSLASYLQTTNLYTRLVTVGATRPILFATNQVEKVRITEADRAELLVGMTAAPFTTAGRGLVAVNGTTDSFVIMNSNLATVGYLYGHSGGLMVAGQDLPLMLGVSGVEKARITTSADAQLLVGTTAAKYLAGAGLAGIDINVSGSGVSLIGLSVNGGPRSSIKAGIGYMAIGSLAADPILLYTNNAERVRIDENGNFGIGVAPGARFDLATGTTNRLRISESSSTLFFDSLNNAASAWFSKYERASAFAWFSAPSGAPSSGMILDTNGNLLVGLASPTVVGGYTSINVNGGSGSLAQFYYGGTKAGHVYGNSAGIGMDTGSAALAINFNVAGALRMQITSTAILDVGNGNVELGWRNIPIQFKGAPYTLTNNDRGTCVRADPGCTTITVPSLADGAVITIYNNLGVSTNLSLVASGVNFRWGTGNPATTNRTIAFSGLVTLTCIGGNTISINGVGIS